MDNAKAKTDAMLYFEKLRDAVAGYPHQEKFERTLSELLTLIEEATPAIEVESMTMDARNLASDMVAKDHKAERVAPEDDVTPNEDPAPIGPAVDVSDCESSLHADMPCLPSHEAS